ncbi:MAG TPA: VWA domain-containing protein [Vicinamibacteria bacterium]|nr:VWA domain-containing protein [Vicinamibacteria bacterium]
MSARTSAWLAVAVLLAAPALTAPPQTPPAGGTAPVFGSGTQAVVLDVIVRDKKGQTVTDLRPDEVEVLEEGQRKAILSFRFVDRTPAPAQGPAAPGVPPSAPPPEAIRNPTLVTLLFDALDAEGRLFARRAALELLEAENRPDLVFSVFVIGNRLQLLQQFTTDRAAVATAVERACSVLDPRGLVPGAAAMEQAADTASQANDKAQAAGDAAFAGGGAAAGAASGQAAVDAGFANVEQRAVDMAENVERSQRGNSSLFGLFALARQVQRLAGRKAIVYFSEGLQVPNQLQPLYRSVVSEANRANLSIYAVDARGLRTTSDFDRARTDLTKSRENVRRQVQSRGGRAVTREDVLAGEVAEDAITMNAQGMLGALSESTGGRLIANSNDVRAGLDRAVADTSGYYEITYDPKLAAFDGSFRRVGVKVRRPGTIVQAREGYFALPPGEGSVDFPWELPLVKMLEASPAPHDFDTRAAAYHFGPEKGGLRYTLVAEIPLDGLAFEGKGGTRRAHFSVLARVRDARGVVSEHFGQDSPVEVPEKSLGALKQGNAVFTRSFTLPPGRHSVELVVLDQVSQRASVRKSVLVVPSPRPGLVLSSLAVVKRTEPVAEGALGSSDPLRNGSNRLVPFVGEPTFRAGETVSLFLVAYPAAGVAEGVAKPSLTLEFSRDGAVVGRSTAELPAPDAAGHIPYVASVPTQSLAPGRYEVAAIVSQGDTAARERAFFTIAAAATN